MSKIVQAVNAMISNSALITDVRQNRSELFFSYKGYKWSISRGGNGEHFLHYYPVAEDIEALARAENINWDDVPMISYSDSELGAKEARESFAELFTLIKERIYGVDKVLNDIISDMSFR